MKVANINHIKMIQRNQDSEDQEQRLYIQEFMDNPYKLKYIKEQYFIKD